MVSQSIDPDEWQSLYASAAAALGSGQLQRAIQLYDSAIHRKPDHAEAYYKRANALNGLGRWELALADYDRAIALNPAYAYAFCNRGTVLERMGRWDEALGSYDRAVALNPGDFLAYYNRASVLKHLKRLEEALSSYSQAIALKGDYFAAYFNRGNILKELERYEAAASSYTQALALDPEHKYLLGTRRQSQMQICDWSGLTADLQQLAAGLQAHKAVSAPFPLLALLESPILQRLAAQIYVREECPPDDSLGAFPPRRRGDKLRIGYFSADFRHHPVSLLSAQLFETHDRSKFDFTAFSFGPATNDAMRARLVRAFDQFIDVRDRSDADVARLARDKGIDIAVDLGGFTEHSRTKIFALRAAPVQISYLGYPGTMGAVYMDYLIGDRTVVPQTHQGHYAEKIVYLPHSFLPNDSTREIAATVFARHDLGLPPDAIVFCCFNNNSKIMPSTFDSWMRILRRTANGVLWLSQGNAAAANNLRQAAMQRGVDADRLVFAPRMASLPEHLARYRAADLFLDTLPYNAHATAIDALWAGLPVLTRPGECYAGRVAASLLKTIGLPELIAASAVQYEDLAVQFAAEPLRLAEVKQKLARNKLKTPLFDTPALTRHLEMAYTRAYERYLANLAPEHIYLG
ncbi:MAG TPA: tetratricopeptide repeat protein [Steroidobacteraceae bacterium]